MAISRGNETKSNDLLGNETLIHEDVATHDTLRPQETSNFRQVEKQYSSDAESGHGEFNTGTMIPRDMTVKLVRSDSANWESYIYVMCSFSFTLFGLFLGECIRSSSSESKNLIIIATAFFALFSFIFIATLFVIKRNQQRDGVIVPMKFLKYTKKTEQKTKSEVKCH